MMKAALYSLLLPLFARGFTVQPSVYIQRSHHVLSMTQESESSPSRRNLVVGSLSSLVASSTLLLGGHNALAVERAVGAYEKACQEAGNCLEKGDWDAAVGWNWGGKDRCDASDPRCGPNGVLLDSAPTGDAVPAVTARVTHQVELSLTIGRGETGTLNLGLYGEATPKSVQELVDFISPSGLLTTSRLLLEEGYGSVSQGVGLQKGGLLTAIAPGQRLLFGVPSQAIAYARANGLTKAGDSFVPQPRPNEQLNSEQSARLHDCAGLVSIPGAGLGYQNNGKEDEAFADGKSSFSSSERRFSGFNQSVIYSRLFLARAPLAFQITASAVPSMDKEGRKVVGQVLDESSMAFLARLAKLPTNKGLKGIIPGQDGGPPLIKVVVKNVEIKTTGVSQETPAS